MTPALIISLLFIVSEPDTTGLDSVLTKTAIYIKKEDLKWIPLPEILSQQIGIVKRSGQLHFRGGRADEVLYLVDGIDITDPFFGIPYITFNNNAISKMRIELDGFSTRHGNTMSGIVNIITKKGEDYHGGIFKYSTAMESGEQKLNLDLGGPLCRLKNTYFFLSGNIGKTDNNSPSILPKSNNGINSLSWMGNLTWNPVPSIKILLKGDISSLNYRLYDHSRSHAEWSEDYPLYRSKYSSISFTFNHKLNSNLSYRFVTGMFNSRLDISAQNGKHYNDWKTIGTRLPWVSCARDSGWYDPETRKWKEAWAEERAWMWYYENVAEYGYMDPSSGEWRWAGEDSLEKLLHAIEALNNRYYTVNEWKLTEDSSDIYYHEFSLYRYIEDIKRYHSDSTFSADSIESSGNMHYLRYNHDEFNRFNYNFRPLWYEGEISNRFVDFSIKARMTKNNLLNFGGYLKAYDLYAIDVEFINRNPYLYTYEGNPFFSALYVSDRFRYKYFTVDFGARLDYFHPRIGDIKTTSTISPRIAASFAPTSALTIYCNAGKFTQCPKISYVYLDTIIFSSVTIGNPDLDWQETSMYTLGLESSLPLELHLNFSLYYKEAKKLTGFHGVSTAIWGHYLVSYSVPDDYDKSTIYGVDISIGSKKLKYIDWAFCYSYLDANCVVNQTYNQTSPVEWDITHSAELDIDISLPDFGRQSNLNKLFSNLDAGIRAIYLSPFPYHAEDLREHPIGIKKANYDYFRVDLRVKRDFHIGSFNIRPSIEIWNLLNGKNVIAVHPTTGKPDDNGNPPNWDLIRYESVLESSPYMRRKYAEDPNNLTEEDAYNLYCADYANWKAYCDNPNHYDIPRTIRFSIAINF